MLGELLRAFSNTLLYTKKYVPFWIRRYYYIVLCSTIYNVALTERYTALWERYVALWERNVTNVVSTQRHIKLLMIIKQ